jgi:small subunit ribosomal protein S2
MSLSIDNIVSAQVHVGTLKSEAHPKTRKYRIDVIGGMVVFNPEMIAAQLENAKEKVQKAKKEGKSVLVVCEKKMYAQELEKLATSAGVSFLNYKVPAGFLTNFGTFQSRVSSMNKMIEHVQSDDFASLTKKEQLVHKRKLAKVERVYKGIKALPKKPDLVIVLDGQMMSSFVDEIQKEGVSNIIISSSDFPRRWDEQSLLMANVCSYKSVNFVLQYILS